MADAGPAFVPPERGDQAPDVEPEPEQLAAGVEPDLWDAERVGSILTAKGAILHMAIGVGQTDWTYTEADISAIAPPLARILNRYDVTRAAAHVGDEAAVAMGFGGYVVRSYATRRAILAARAAAPDVPITGVPAHDAPAPSTPAGDGDDDGGEIRWTG